MAFSHLASRDGTTQEEFSFAIHQQVLLPALSSQSVSRHNFSANSPHTVSRTMTIHITVVSSPTVMTSRCSFVRADAYLRQPLRRAYSAVPGALPRPARFRGFSTMRQRACEGTRRRVDSTTYMQIDARRTSTSSARVNTTTSCTATVPGASSAGLSAPCLACNAMYTGARDST